MGVAVIALAAVGSVTVLAALGLCGLAWREAGICRHVDAQTRPQPRVYDWECENDCPDCASPLDPRDVDLWGRQIIAADENQIMREVTR